MKGKGLCLMGALFLFIWGCAGPEHFHRVEGRTVTFYLLAPSAKDVRLAQSLDGFSPREAKLTNTRLWEVTLPAAREFRYFYLVDGKPHLPPCPFREKDDFGSENCIFMP